MGESTPDPILIPAILTANPPDVTVARTHIEAASLLRRICDASSILLAGKCDFWLLLPPNHFLISQFPRLFFRFTADPREERSGARCLRGAVRSHNNTPVPSGPEKGLLLAQHADEEGDAGQFAWPDPTSVQDLPGEYRHGHEQQGSYCGEEHYVWLCGVYC